MSIHLYSIKLFRNNFITYLFFYESLNYESNLIRNNYYILKITLVIALAPQLS